MKVTLRALISSAFCRQAQSFIILVVLLICGSLRSAAAGSEGALHWKKIPGGRRAAVPVSASGSVGFNLVPSAVSGIQFTNAISRERYTTNQIYLNGSGVAAGDVDEDGWCDLFFAGLGDGSRLYKNEGAWRFRDITQDAGLGGKLKDATGAAFVDLDGDGHLDLVVNTVGFGTHCFMNDGQGRFLPGPVLNATHCGSSLAVSDIDGDGDLDLYVVNYRLTTVRDDPSAKYRMGQDSGGRPVVLEYNGRSTQLPDLEGRFVIGENGRVIEKGEIDALYRNDGGGRFTLVPFTQGAFLDEQGQPLIKSPADWGLSAMFRDLDGDGLPDLYVCNDFESPDRIWKNLGQGRFQAWPLSAIRHTSLFSMGVDFADIDRDGWVDGFVVDMMGSNHRARHVQIGGIPPNDSPVGPGLERTQYSHNTLLRNRGDGTFAESAWISGVEASGWSWTPIFIDVDLDGYEDLLITAGHQRDAMNSDVIEQGAKVIATKASTPQELLDLNNRFMRLEQPLTAFRNRGNGRFENASQAWRFDIEGVSHGMCLVDLDNDGDQDVVINRMNQEALLLKNEAAAPRVAVRLKGKPGNTQGIGATVTLRGGAVAQQSQEIIAGGRYLSSDQALRTFASGKTGHGMRLEVRWRSGLMTHLDGVTPNALYEIDESASEASTSPKTSPPAARPFFDEVSDTLRHRHKDEFFNDLAVQPLMPWRLSQLGPGVCWHDFDGDGWIDLAVGGGRGGTVGLFMNDQHGGFHPHTNSAFSRVLARDQTALVAMGSLLIAGSANYEDGSTNGGAIRVYDLSRNTSGGSILGPTSSTGPIALGDLDGDGDLDLFVGGRVIAKRFPESPGSQWYRNEKGRFLPAQRWPDVGMVSGAVMTDLDTDGDPDLVLASEWGALSVLRNDKGSFETWDPAITVMSRDGVASAPIPLSRVTGWWHGVAAGDFDGDGRMDFVASNWGFNSQYQATPEQPWRLYYGDLEGSGQPGLIESRVTAGREWPQRTWRMVRSALPFLQERVTSYENYASLSVQEIYQERLAACKQLEVRACASMVFLNRGDHFEASNLPEEAQMAPAFGIAVADLDGDGFEDLFLSQNFFPMNPEAARHDSGRGLWLKGDGKGGFSAVSGKDSGIRIYGEQRGCAVGDFDGDGRVDLVVAQNGAETRLYRNRGAEAGLRIRLNGGPQNRDGIGAAIRIKYAEEWGPAREIHAGAGYWSQDSPVQVMTLKKGAQAVSVRWPWGKEIQYTLPSGAQEIEIDRVTGVVGRRR